MHVSPCQELVPRSMIRGFGFRGLGFKGLGFWGLAPSPFLGILLEFRLQDLEPSV